MNVAICSRFTSPRGLNVVAVAPLTMPAFASPLIASRAPMLRSAMSVNPALVVSSRSPATSVATRAMNCAICTRLTVPAGA